MMFDTGCPQPNDSFTWVQVPHATGSRPALVCTPLEPFADHLFTTAVWSRGGWDELAAAMRVPAGGLVRVHQVHGRAVFVRRAGGPAAVHRAGAPIPEIASTDVADANLPDADIILCDDPLAAIAVQTADCVPLLVADRRSGAVAAAHAGWRGLAAGVPGATVHALARECDSRPADLIAAIGPAIGPCCYEVGADVRHRFEVEGAPPARIGRWFLERPRSTWANPSIDRVSASGRPGHWFFDAWQAARDQLEAAGVPAAQIHAAELCTASHADTFCSYRRDGAGAGRIAGAIRAASPARGLSPSAGRNTGSGCSGRTE
jgi:hypothetical protein